MEMPEVRYRTNKDTGDHGVLQSLLEAEGEDEGTKEAKETSGKAVIIGSGDMSIALSMALSRVGLTPVVGSRDPDSARTRLQCANVPVLTVPEALTKGDLILLAIPAKYHISLPRHLLQGKVVVDMSNRSALDKHSHTSLAERLQENFPDCYVVKAFNTMSAYGLLQGNIRGSKEIPICGDSKESRQRVCSLVRTLGLTPKDVGVLRNAQEIEAIPFHLFPEWKGPVIVALSVFFFFYILLFFRRQICPNIEGKEPWNWNKFQPLPLKNAMVSLAITGGVLLLSCYVPGMIAAYIQLIRGTKYLVFPSWLDRWLKSRKQLGLLALFTSSLHACMSIFTQMGSGMANPASWSQQLYIALGVVLSGIMCVLGVTSLPSVSSSLTWREFSFVQRYLGWTSVLVLTSHAFFKGWRRLLQNRFTCVIIPHENQIIVPLCLIVLLFKLPLLFPCVNSHLDKLRGGHVRKSKGSSA